MTVIDLRESAAKPVTPHIKEASEYYCLAYCYRASLKEEVRTVKFYTLDEANMFMREMFKHTKSFQVVDFQLMFE